jgi:hypothetical protein
LARNSGKLDGAIKQLRKSDPGVRGAVADLSNPDAILVALQQVLAAIRNPDILPAAAPELFWRKSIPAATKLRNLTPSRPSFPTPAQTLSQGHG